MAVKTRDALRGRLMGAKKFRSERIKLFGEDVEIRQPSVGQILDAQEFEDQKKALVNILVNYCFIPGTEEKIFEDTDEGAIMEWPVGEWFTEINQAIQKLTNIDVAGAEGN